MILRVERTISGSILDIGGGGEGVIGRLYGQSVTAIDNRQDELDEAPSGCKKLLMDARKLDFADESFDNITFFYSLMFMDKETQRLAAAEALRVLKNGGKLLVWDAEIEKAYPEAFSVELEIELGGERLKTTYGVISDIVNQTAETAAALFAQFGAEAIRSESKNGQFYLEIIKK
jgi:ubiquinone/menaquinone biosynthesis C-methylase UbiE